MKIKISILLLVLSKLAISQKIDTEFYPKKNQLVTSETYNYGKQVLRNTYDQINENGREIGYIDHWNIAIAFSYMGVNADSIYAHFTTSKNMGGTDFCMILNYGLQQSKTNDRLRSVLGERLLEILSDCEGHEIKPMSISDYSIKKSQSDLDGLNEALIDRLIVLMEKDQRYRANNDYLKNREFQNQLDREIQEDLALIFDEFGYPGKSLVGTTFMNYACLLLEHGGEIAHQKKYFPLVAKAYKNGELAKNPFLMLIDRIEWKTTGKQIFGSHAGIPFAENERIEQVRREISR